VVLTAGLDNQAQPERLEIAVWAWGPGYESWLVDTRQINGSPGAAEPWDEVAKILNTDWPREGGGTMQIAKACADTGGQHTQGVYQQIRRLRDPRLIGIKGVPGWNKAAPVNGPTMVDVTERGKKIKRGMRLWTVAVDVFKSDLYRLLHLTRGDAAGYPAGWVHLPQGMDTEQVKQLVGEQLITVQSRLGYTKLEWQKLRANEQLDMRVYARAALTVLGSDRYGDRFWNRFTRGDAPELEPDAPAPIAVSPVASVTTPPPRDFRALARRLVSRTA
jgi:phage terminase large subunit GpA-like protein